MPKIMENMAVMEMGELIQRQRKAIDKTRELPSNTETAVQSHQRETCRELITAR